MQKIEYGGKTLDLPAQDTFTMDEWRYVKKATGGMSAIQFPKALSEMDADAWFALVVVAVCRAEGRPRHQVEDEVSQSNLYAVLQSYEEEEENEIPPALGSPRDTDGDRSDLNLVTNPDALGA